MTEPVAGQLKGIGIRLDPQEVLIAPHTYPDTGLTWGYTIIDKTQIPTMYMDGEWKPVVPEGVWLQMLDNWEDLAKNAKQVFEEYPEYLEYPEVKALIK